MSRHLTLLLGNLRCKELAPVKEREQQSETYAEQKHSAHNQPLCDFSDKERGNDNPCSDEPADRSSLKFPEKPLLDRAVEAEAEELQREGAFMTVIECTSSALAKDISETLSVPTIGIGAGKYCSGQIVVIDDILGKFTDFTPKFVKKYANLHDVVLHTAEMYKREVKEDIFPSEKESFELNKEEKAKLEG